GFALTAVDRDMMRWATFDGTSASLDEHASAVPANAAGPWLAVPSPGDTLLAAHAVPAANVDDAELHILFAPAAGAAVLSGALATIPGALAPGAAPVVAFAASRTGAQVGLAWVDAKAGDVEVLTLSVAGKPAGSPV